MISPITATSYDQVPYEGAAIETSHPDRLATVATLFGLQPPPIDRCRVLELGGANGANLIPMALALPESTFLGIDLSARQVDDGKKVIAALGLCNLELRHASIMDVDAAWGQFDYIICHGVYSWVPPAVQDHILRICADNLADNGVAYVSYNTYPGWHLRGIIRDMLYFRGKQFSDPQVGLQKALTFFDFVVQVAGQDNTPYAAVLKSELELVLQKQASYLLHEHMEDVNAPVYFHQFVERAAARGLRYLGEPEIWGMLPGNLSVGVEKVLSSLFSDRIHVEQAMDFMRGRAFRRTLLCRQSVQPAATVAPERIKGLIVASPAKSAGEGHNPLVEGEQGFIGTEGAKIYLKDPLLKTALTCLAEHWPQAVAFEELLQAVRRRLGSARLIDLDRDRDDLAAGLAIIYTTGSTRILELHVHVPKLCPVVTERPLASPLARLQARSESLATNLLFKTYRLDEFARQLLPCLDGSRDRAALEAEMTAGFGRGAFTLRKEGQPIEDHEEIRRYVESAVAEHLRQFARHAFLVG